MLDRSNISVHETKPPILKHSKAMNNLLAPVSSAASSSSRDLTYDDILASMNLKVQDGQLQYIQPVANPEPPVIVKPRIPVQTKRVQIKDKSILSANMPYIQGISVHAPAPVVLTKEEREKMIRETMEKQRAAWIHARQIKTTKLLFTNPLSSYPVPSIRSTTHYLKFVKK